MDTIPHEILEDFSSQVTLVCVKLAAKAKHNSVLNKPVSKY